MRVVRIAFLITLLLTALIGSGAAFVLLVEMDFHLTVHGRVEPVRVLPIRLGGAGKLVRVAAPGPVEQGSVLVELSSSSAREQLKLVEAQIASLRQELGKETGRLGNPQRRFSLTQSLRSQEREASRLRRDINNAIIHAPFDGVVMSVHVEPGEYVAQTGQLALVLGDVSRFIFRAQLSRPAGRELQDGQVAKLRLDAFPYLKYGEVDAVVKRSEIHLDAESVTTQTLLLDVNANPPFPLTPGLTGRADVVIFRGTTLQYFLRDLRE